MEPDIHILSLSITKWQEMSLFCKQVYKVQASALEKGVDVTTLGTNIQIIYLRLCKLELELEIMKKHSVIFILRVTILDATIGICIFKIRK